MSQRWKTIAQSHWQWQIRSKRLSPVVSYLAMLTEYCSFRQNNNNTEVNEASRKELVFTLGTHSFTILMYDK